MFRDVTSYGLANDLNAKFYGKFRCQQVDKPRRRYADLMWTVPNNELYTPGGQAC